ncbi:hypothetical protein FF1_030069 [Malus domestica]
MDLNEPSSSKWSSTTSIKFKFPDYLYEFKLCATQHVRPLNCNGRSVSRDFDGFPVTCRLQIEHGIPVLSQWLIFNKFKFVVSKGVKLGPAFLLTRMTGGSTVGDMAPYQAFAVGGLGSV